MIKRFFEDFYKVTFNHFANKDGLSQFTHLIACAATSLMFFIFIINIISLIGFTLNKPLSIPNNKGFAWLFCIIYLFVAYYIVFSVLKLSKTGDNNSLFFIDQNKVKLIWIAFFSNFLIVIIVCLLSITLNKK